MWKDLRKKLREDKTPADVGAADSGAERQAEQQRQLEAVRASHPRLHASLAQLNTDQLRAVLDQSPSVLVRAQVGSGKTSVLVHKVLYLHLVLGVPLRRMAILTFTHKAADEIRTRIEALAGDEANLGPADFWLTGTFHGVARSLLKEALDLSQIGYRPDFAVLDARGQEALWQRLIAEHQLNIKYVARLAQRMEGLTQGRTRHGHMREEDDLQRLHALSRAARQAANAMDFADLIEHACDLLGQQALDPPLDWLIVDEFQDCEPRELELLGRLRGVGTRIFAVGDPHQVIYAWRGSTPALLDRAQQTFGCTPLSLPLNYRSTHAILGAARAVLGLQPGRGGLLVGSRGDGALVTIRRHHNPSIEGLYLAQRIAGLHADGTPYREVAVLYRTRRQGAPLRAALEHAGIACQESARVEAKDQPAVAWTLDLLQAALHPDDDGTLRAALLHPHYGLLPARLWNVRSFRLFCEQSGLQGRRAARVFFQAALAKTKTPRTQRDLRDALDALTLFDGLDDWLRAAPRACEAMVEHLNLRERLRPTAARHEEDLAAVQRLLRALLAFAQLADAADLAGGLRSAVAQAALGGLHGLAESLDPQAEAVRLMTLHAAKGLEFDHVFISGANQGLVPLARAWGDADAEAEERRLLFVGMTRARDHLELSVHTQPAHATAQPMPSSYLYAIPSALVHWIDGPQPAESQTTVSTLAIPGVQALPSAPVASDVPWHAGQTVKHPRYGQGRVVRLQDDLVLVDFAKLGERSFPLRMCPLVPLPA